MAVNIDFHLRGMSDDYLLTLRDRNEEVAEQHQRNADQMREIVAAMDAEIERRGLNAV
jgi:hypothetical protein